MAKIRPYLIGFVAFWLIAISGVGAFPYNINGVGVPDVNTRQIVKTMPRLPDSGGVLEVFVAGSQGSCFIVDEKDGWYYAITAAHVVQVSDYFGRYPDFSVSPDVRVDRARYQAEVVRVDSEMDVALIRFMSDEEYPIYKISRAKIGEPCISMGWSRGAFLQYKGYVVSLDYTGKIVANGGVVPGCSGGPLMNAKGEIIGVTVAFPVYGPFGYDSSSLHVPARFIEALIVIIGD